MKDYGSAWRILRPSSLTDQIFIKAQRIRSIEEKGKQKVIDGIDNEFIGIVNYAVMALIQLGLHSDAPLELNPDEALKNYEQRVYEVKSLMMDKNGVIPVRLLDASGKTIRFTNVSVQRGRNQFTLDGLGNLQPGVYFIEVSDNSKGVLGRVKVLKQ